MMVRASASRSWISATIHHWPFEPVNPCQLGIFSLTCGKQFRLQSPLFSGTANGSSRLPCNFQDHARPCLLLLIVLVLVEPLRNGAKPFTSFTSFTLLTFFQATAGLGGLAPISLGLASGGASSWIVTHMAGMAAFAYQLYEHQYAGDQDRHTSIALIDLIDVAISSIHRSNISTNVSWTHG